MSKYTLVPNCTVEDDFALANLSVVAWWDEPWYRGTWTDPQSFYTAVRHNAMGMPMDLLQNRPTKRHQKVVDSQTGEIVGYASWNLPASHPETWVEAQTPDVSEDVRKSLEQRADRQDPCWIFNYWVDIYRPVGEMVQKIQPVEPFMRLCTIDVHPDFRRQGIASMLLKSGIEVADSLGMDIYHVAKGEKALALYKKHGFELLDQNVQDLKDWNIEGTHSTYLMVKRPSQK